MKLRNWIVPFIALASPATAQTTNCQWIGNTWNCQGTPAPQQQGGGINWSILNQQPQAQTNNFYEAFMRGQAERARIDAERELAQARAVEARAAQQSAQGVADDRETKTTVGRLVSIGDCKGAEEYAVTRGDFDLARGVRGYCATLPKQ